jgi:hypothetical protein
MHVVFIDDPMPSSTTIPVLGSRRPGYHGLRL